MCRTEHLAWLAVTLAAVLLTACRQDMHDQPRVEPLEASQVFADGRGSRAPPPGTVPWGRLHDDPRRHRGREPDGDLVQEVPVPLTLDRLRRGRERFDIFCAPCHGRTGDGLGMVVQRGFPAPPSLHEARLREAPAGHLFDVVTSGFGRMGSYAHQLTADDRWAVVAYVRALQLAARVPAARLDDADRQALARGTSR